MRTAVCARFGVGGGALNLALPPTSIASRHCWAFLVGCRGDTGIRSCHDGAVTKDLARERNGRDARPYHHGDLRNALIAEAVRVVEADGIEGLNLRRIARRIGVSHASSYHHFADKAALMTAITAQAFRMLAVELRPCLDLPGTAVDRLVELGVAYIRFGYRNRGYFLVMWRPELRDPALEAQVVDAGREAYDVIRTGVEDCHRECTGISQSPAVMTFGAWSMAHGIASLVIDGPLGRLVPDEAAVKELAASIIRATADGVYRTGKAA